jgi:hypothetical protein
MGHNLELDTRYWGSSFFKEQSIIFGNILSTLYTTEYSERIPIGINSNNPDFYKKLPEFEPIIKPGSLIELKKTKYLAPDSICCVIDDRYGWVTDDGVMTNTASFDKTLLTCHPSSIEVGFNNICDEFLYNTCLLSKDTNLIGKCSVWLDGVLKRYAFDMKILTNINNYMTNQCSKDVNNHPYCKHWLSAIRNSGNPNFEYIADSVLNSQINKENFKCAFPPEYIVSQTNILEPLECWYRECAFSETWKLLTKNIEMKNTCSISDCKISISRINNILENTEINAICNGAIVYRNSLSQSTILRDTAKFKEFPILQNTFIFILIILFIIYLILYINAKSHNI